MISFFKKSKTQIRSTLFRPPPFLIGAALVFWGWQTDLMIWALPMALLIESNQYLRARWEFDNADLNRIFDLCVILGVGVAIILYNSETRLQFFFKWLQSMPFFFLPMMLAQVFGTREKLPLSIFSWVLRRTPDRPLAKVSFNVTWIYFALCLLAASASNNDSIQFYFGVVALVVLALAAVRPLRLPFPFWAALIILAVTGGYFGHRFLRSGQANLEVAIGNWLANAAHRGRSDYRETRTAIGQSSRMRLTGRIVLRVRPEPGSPPPALLREATYQFYRRGVWTANDSQFDRVFVDTNDVAVLQPNAKPKFAAHIAGYYDDGKGLLALPRGVAELREFTALLETNHSGVARADGGPSFIDFLARYNPDTVVESPPDGYDLNPPGRDRTNYENIVAELGLKSKSDEEKLRTLAAWFEKKFTYTLNGHVPKPGQTPMAQFLTETHAGHCEHFATAAVLLLRLAGVPARYAIGYAVDPSARHGDTWYVRERHGHAWVMVWRSEHARWEEFDPTPPSREQIEESRASDLEGISDFGSNVWYRFSQWRWRKTDYTHYIPWLLVPLILFLLWRILNGKRRRHTAKDSSAETPEPIWPGLDSELYLITQHLERQPHEPLLQWQQRLSAYHPHDLARAFALHRRFRFDPHGLTPEDRAALKTEVQRWLADFAARDQQKIKPAPGSLARV